MNKIKLLPIGGLGEFGKNMFLIEDEDEILIMDCGIGFPEEYLKGIDLLIPDFTYLRNLLKEKKLYLLITHAHEDHIGAIPFFIEHFKADIYASPLTCAFIERNMTRYEKAVNELYVLMPFQKVKTKNFQFYPIPVTHSVPDSYSYVVESRAGRILFTGDFKIEEKPFFGKPFDPKPFIEEGHKGVDLLIMDSTNSLSPGSSEAEISIYPTLSKFFESKDRVVLTTFSSHIDRIGMVIKLCLEFKRKLFVTGRGFETSIEVAKNMGYLSNIDEVLVPIEELANFADSQVCILATGSQGEYRSAMFRLYDNAHSGIKIRGGDAIILSSKIIPGNEKSVYRMVSALTKMGAKVHHESNSNVHVSGHAKQDELTKMFSYTKPKCFIPAHGDFVMLQGNADLATKCDVQDIIVIENGQSVEWSKSGWSLGEKEDIKLSLIESESRNEIHYDSAKERLKIGEFGLVLCSVIKDYSKKKLLASKTVKVVGLSDQATSSKISDKAYLALREALIEISFDEDFEKYQNQLRIAVRKVFKDSFGMKPVTIVQLHEIK